MNGRFMKAFTQEQIVFYLFLAILNDKTVTKFYKIAKELGMDVICEVHDNDELSRALKIEVECIGINNRNLKTLKINLETFNILSKSIPKDIIKYVKVELIVMYN